MDKEIEYRDKFIICCDCGREFTFSIGEQKFYNAKLLSPRKRCADCLKKRKASLNPDKEVRHEQ